MPWETASQAAENKPAPKTAQALQLREFFLKGTVSGSELHPRSKLHSTIVVGGLGHGTKAAVARAHVGKGEALVIGHVEHFGANLQLGPFADLKFLGKRHIEIADAFATQIGKVSWRVPRNIVPRIGKAILIQVREPGAGGLAPTEAGGQLRADYIGTLVAVGEAPCGIENGDGLAGLQGDKAVERPTADDAVGDAVHASSDPAVAANRQIENKGRGQAMRGVVGANAMFRLQVVKQLRIVVLQIADPGIAAGGGIVGGFG